MTVLIPEDPFKGLLDDDGATAMVSEQLSTWTNMLRDMANYGSHLIPRAYSSSEKTLGDAVVIGILLRQVVAMVDAIQILLCRSAVHAAALQLRALFEASVYLQWIITGDLENKACFYYVHNLLRLRLWARRVQRGTAESTNFNAIFDTAGLPLDQSIGDEGKRQADELDRVLSQDRFNAIQRAFNDWKKQNRRNPQWYSPLGVTDLRNMAAGIKKEPLYVMVYGSGSEVMHASNYGQHVSFAGNRITFQSIRHPKEFSRVVKFTAIIAIDVFMRVLEKYREGERVHQFGRKYRDKWQAAFMSIPELNIKASEARL